MPCRPVTCSGSLLLFYTSNSFAHISDHHFFGHFEGMVPYSCCWLLVRAANVGNVGNKPLSCEHCLEMVISRQPGDGGSQPMVATFVCNKSIKRQPQLSAPDNTLYFSVQEVLIVQCPAKPKPRQSSHYTYHFSLKNFSSKCFEL